MAKRDAIPDCASPISAAIMELVELDSADVVRAGDNLSS